MVEWRSTGTLYQKLVLQKNAGGKKTALLSHPHQVGRKTHTSDSPGQFRSYAYLFTDAKEQVAPNSYSPTPSSQSTSTLTPEPAESDDQPAELSITSLLTTTPLTLDSSSVNTPRRWMSSEFSSETSQSYMKKGMQDHRVRFVPQLEAVTELDELWKRFLSSSLVSKENVGVVRCTCGAKKHHLEQSSKRGDTNIADVSEETCNYTSRSHPFTRTRSVLIERAVQTSPMITHSTHHHGPLSSPVMFTVTSSQSTRPQLGNLSLSEAFALSHPEFIEASLRRQREIKHQQRSHAQQMASSLRKELRKPEHITSESSRYCPV